MNLVDKAQEEIKNMILNKNYDENGYLPSEGELSKQIEVSRATIREAVRSMQVRGFVRRVHGKGIKVVDQTVQVLAQSMKDMMEQRDTSLNELLEVRRIIEIQAAQLASQRASSKELDGLLESIKIMEASTSREEVYINADLDFHIKLVAAAENNILTCITKAYTPLLKKLIIVSNNTTENIENKFHFHRNIYQALIEKNGTLAGEYMNVHLCATEKNRISSKEDKE